MRPSFDCIAPFYGQLERFTFGPALQRARCACIDHLMPSRTLLCLGEGEGKFAAEVSRRFPRIHLTCVDSSIVMLGRLKETLRKEKSGLRHPRLVHADVLAPDPGPWARHQYDAVSTHFFLDCFTQDMLLQLVPRICQVLRPGGIWLVSDFVSEAELEGLNMPVWQRGLHRITIESLYLFFRMTTGIPGREIVHTSPILEAFHCKQVEQQRFLNGLLVSSAFEFVTN